MLYKHLGINDNGHLTIGGLDACDLAAEYGTPLYVLDEDVIRGMLTFDIYKGMAAHIGLPCSAVHFVQVAGVNGDLRAA